MKKLAPIEWLRGFVAVLPICFKIGWIGLSIAGLSGICWMLGGTYGLWIRRILMNILICVISYIILHNMLVFLTFPLGWAVTSIGDGFPDRRLGTYDTGSWLGRQVEHIFNPIDNQEIEFCGELTKWIIAVLFQLGLIPIYLA